MMKAWEILMGIAFVALVVLTIYMLTIVDAYGSVSDDEIAFCLFAVVYVIGLASVCWKMRDDFDEEMKQMGAGQ
jgi:uncharacterized membrane protein YqjE